MYLHNSETGVYLREATIAETLKSIEAQWRDDGKGIITVDGIKCLVNGNIKPIKLSEQDRKSMRIGK